MGDKRQYEIDLQNGLIKSGQFPTCTNCEEWGPNEECMKFKMKPPATVIVTGCIHWIMTIPF